MGSYPLFCLYKQTKHSLWSLAESKQQCVQANKVSFYTCIPNRGILCLYKQTRCDTPRGLVRSINREMYYQEEMIWRVLRSAG